MKLLDTDVLIDLFHGNAAARSYIRQRSTEHEQMAISAITLAEMLGGMRPDEEIATTRLLNQFTIVDINAGVARQAARFMRAYHDDHHVDLSDALIAASAFLLGADIVARNVRHNPMPEVLVIEPYRRGAVARAALN